MKGFWAWGPGQDAIFSKVHSMLSAAQIRSTAKKEGAMAASSMSKCRWCWVLLGVVVMLSGLFFPGLARANNFWADKDFSIQVPLGWTQTLNLLKERDFSFHVPLGWTQTLDLLKERDFSSLVTLRLASRDELVVSSGSTRYVDRDMAYTTETIDGTLLQGEHNNLTDNLYVRGEDNIMYPKPGGTYGIGGGRLVAVNEIIGNRYSTSPSRFIQQGGTNTVLEVLEIGTNGRGTYEISGGTGGILSARTIRLGDGGAFSQTNGSLDFSTFNQTGGSATFTNSCLYLGRNQGSSSTYNLGGTGRLSADAERIGERGDGTFNQTGGSNTVENTFSMGIFAGSRGTYNLEGAGSLTTWIDELIGINGSGTFNQKGNTTHVANFGIYLGLNPGGIGTYFLDSGSLSATDSQFATNTGIYVGYNGNGKFFQTGGTNTATNLYLGFNSGSNGTYDLSRDGRLSAAAAYIGYNGTGTFTQTGGSNTVTKTLTLAVNPGSSGTYNFRGGTLSTGAIQINAGGAFNITGISPTMTGDVTNNGTVKTTNAKVTWSGAFTNNGAYISQHSDQTFNQDLVVGMNGYLVGASQDIFIFKANFQNQSTKNVSWDTDLATIQFDGPNATKHTLYVAGEDIGITPEANNFYWRVLNIAHQNIYLKDGNTGNTTGFSDGAQYVDILTGADVNTAAKVVNNIFGDLTYTLNIYYDKNNPNNAYLMKYDYTFAGGLGHLYADDVAAAPLPPSLLLLGSGLLGLGALGWRRKRV
jgi:hypothetical protein